FALPRSRRALLYRSVRIAASSFSSSRVLRRPGTVVGRGEGEDAPPGGVGAGVAAWAVTGAAGPRPISSAAAAVTGVMRRHRRGAGAKPVFSSPRAPAGLADGFGPGVALRRASIHPRYLGPRLSPRGRFGVPAAVPGGTPDDRISGRLQRTSKIGESRVSRGGWGGRGEGGPSTRGRV